MEEYCSLQWNSYQQTQVERTDIPVSKAQLVGRAAEFESGITTWMTGLKNPTWRAVRDAHTGHSIHVVTDRSYESLTADLHLGLRLMNWMSATPVVWYWWDQNQPRILPAFTLPGKIHVNGGWAVPGVPEVHVYRREEAHKVLLHEMIHALRMDIPSTLLVPVRAQFETLLGRKLWPHLGEAYTEFFAEWLWSLVAPSLREAKKRWTYQLDCSKQQAIQIWTRIHGTDKDEDTNIFAYYILKWVLMEHSEAVLLAPIASRTHWIPWWLEAQPFPTDHSRPEELRMGMTCGLSSNNIG